MGMTGSSYDRCSSSLKSISRCALWTAVEWVDGKIRKRHHGTFELRQSLELRIELAERRFLVYASEIWVSNCRALPSESTTFAAPFSSHLTSNVAAMPRCLPFVKDCPG